MLKCLAKIFARQRLCTGDGKISALLDWCSLPPELSGRGNVFLKGAILGLKQRSYSPVLMTSWTLPHWPVHRRTVKNY